MNQSASSGTAGGLSGRLRRLTRVVLAPTAGRGPPEQAPDDPGAIARLWQDRTLAILRDRWNWSTPVEMRLVPDSGLAFRDLRLRREGTGERIIAELPAEMGRQVLSPDINRRSAVYLVQFRAAGRARQMVVTLTDGNRPGVHRFSPSTPFADVVPIPDPYFLRDNGYSHADQVWQGGPDWADRDDALVWRGAPNGAGLVTWDRVMADRPGVVQRCRMVLMCQGTDIDAAFVFPKHHKASQYEPFFRGAGLLGTFKDRMEWVRHRFALDIDGHTNAWDNLAVRLKLGCCVLKVESPAGFRQWYYDRLRPWEHFVPVRADLSDLSEKYDWVRSRPGEAQAIAAAGRAVAGAMTLTGELEEAARLITANQDR